MFHICWWKPEQGAQQLPHQTTTTTTATTAAATTTPGTTATTGGEAQQLREKWRRPFPTDASRGSRCCCKVSYHYMLIHL